VGGSEIRSGAQDAGAEEKINADNILESPPSYGFVPLKGVGAPTHEYDMLSKLEREG
jgi:hypothetical protein